MPRPHMIVLCATMALTGTYGNAYGNDARIIANPALPRDGAYSAHVQQAWSFGLDDAVIGQITSVFTDHIGRVCLLDTQLNQLYIVDHGGTIVQTIGRDGEGPGEFRMPTGAFALPSHGYAVLQGMPSRVITFDATGTPGETTTPMVGSGDTHRVLSLCMEGRAVGENLVMLLQYNEQRRVTLLNTTTLGLFNRRGVFLAALWSFGHTIDYAQVSEASTEERFQMMHHFTTSGDRCYVAPKHAEYEVQVFSSTGSLLQVITRDAVLLPRTIEECQHMLELMVGDPTLTACTRM